MQKRTSRLGYWVAFAIAAPLFAQAQPEVPVAVVLRVQDGKFKRQKDQTGLRLTPGEVLFSGDRFETGRGPATILYCSTRQVLDLPANASGVAGARRLTLQPGAASAIRSVPECEMPSSERQPTAASSHLGQSTSGSSRVLTSSETADPETVMEPGIARLLVRLTRAERAGNDAEALSLSRILFHIWPDAAWLRVKVFQHEKATAARNLPPVVAPGISALVIGISHYQDRVSQLKFAGRDALLIRDYLKSQRGGKLSDDRIALLLDDAATAGAILDAFYKVLTRPTETVIIYIAAHGYTMNGHGYIAATDTKVQNLVDTGVPLRAVNTLITAGLSGVKTIFVYIDTCFSGYLQGLNSTTIQTPPRGKLWGFAASRVDEKSYEYPELDKGHGVFTWFLNQVLTASVPEPSKVSTIRDATRYVRDSVVDYTKKRSHQQHPVEFGNFEDDTPLFDVTVETPKTAPAVPSAAALGDDAGPWGRGFNERDPRLEYELEGERIVSRYLDGEASPLIKADFERAADNFDEARKLAPESVWLESRSAFSHGRALIFDRRYDEAIRLLDQAIRLDPAGAISYNALGIAYLEQSEYPKALAAFEDAVSRAPLWAYAWHNKALAESQMGNYRAAIKSYQRGIEVAPQYFYLPYNLGALYQGLNRLREAEAQYRKAAKVDATKGEPYNALGTIRAIQGKRKEARRFFEESLRLDPTLELARRNLAAL